MSSGDRQLLVVSQAPGVHREVLDLLRMLRKLAKATAEDSEIGRKMPRVSIHEEPDRVKAIREVLAKKVTLNFRKTPLDEVVKSLKDTYGIEIPLDKRALDGVGLRLDTPVTIAVRQISLGAALRVMLRPLDLTYSIRNEALLITTPEMAEERLTMFLYPVGDLIEPRGDAGCEVSPLLNVIAGCVQPASWDDVGGPGSIAPLPRHKFQALAISQTPDAHEEVLGLLTALRRVRAQVVEGKPAAAIFPAGTRPEDLAVERAFRKALARRASVDWKKTPLRDVVAFIRRRTRANVLPDRLALNDANVHGDTLVSLVAEDISLRSILQLVLRQLDLAWTVSDEVVWITTPEQAESRLTTRLYPVGDLKGRQTAGADKSDLRNEYSGLKDAICSTVAASTWDDAGGPGGVAPLRLRGVDVLVVSQTSAVHEKIEDLLRQLRKAVGGG